MNKWVNPSRKPKTENEFSSQDAITYSPSIPFSAIKKQVGKKKVSGKSKKQRIADKSISLAERLGYERTK